MTHRPPPGDALETASDAGWTLLELLVGLILLSLISVLLTQSLRTGRGALAAIERQSSDASVEAVQRYLRRAIGQARAIRLPAARTDAPLIDAADDHLALVSDHVPAGQYAGLYSLALSLQPGQHRGLLDLVEVRTLLRPAPAAGQSEPARPQLRSRLMRDITGATFAYFGIRDEEHGAQWGPDWPDTAQLPQLVAVTVTMPAGDHRQWPPLVIAPAAGP